MTKQKSDLEIFDISDVEIDFIHTKSEREVMLRMRSKTRFNLMKSYLALKDLTERIEQELGIMEEFPDLQ